jgi:hypothetical protein
MEESLEYELTPAFRAAGQIASMLQSTEHVGRVWSAVIAAETVSSDIIPNWAGIIEEDSNSAVDRIIEDLFRRHTEFKGAWDLLGGRDCYRETILRNLVTEYENGHFG